MSINVLRLVFDCPLSPSAKLVLLSYADHCDDSGLGIFPSVATTARRTGLSRRAVQLHTQRLADASLLISEGMSRYGTNRWRINLDALAALAGTQDVADSPVSDGRPPQIADPPADLPPAESTHDDDDPLINLLSSVLDDEYVEYAALQAQRAYGDDAVAVVDGLIRQLPGREADNPGAYLVRLIATGARSVPARRSTRASARNKKRDYYDI